MGKLCTFSQVMLTGARIYGRRKEEGRKGSETHWPQSHAVTKGTKSQRSFHLELLL